MTKHGMTIQELQRELEQSFTVPSALQPLIPPGFRHHVALYGPKRKMKRNASAKNWSPESGEIRICFERNDASSSAESAQKTGWKPGKDGHYRFPRELGKPEAKPPELTTIGVGSSPLKKQVTPAPEPLSDLIRALDRAESRPGFNFVALKWFRDVVLLEEGFPWVQSESARHNALRDAIEKRWILTGSVQNPRSPQFPVTSIRLNRLLPEVRAILGTSGQGGEDFEPVEIRGESLSTTILRERR